jgi:SAM-dependent methyltransferase
MTNDQLAYASPFPPRELMQRVSGLTDDFDFAKHGCVIFDAFSSAISRFLTSFRSILDFGVGCGRLARMFRGFTGRYVGVDVDPELLSWVESALPWVEPALISPGSPLPFHRASFDCLANSVFTHMSEPRVC